MLKTSYGMKYVTEDMKRERERESKGEIQYLIMEGRLVHLYMSPLKAVLPCYSRSYTKMEQAHLAIKKKPMGLVAYS